MPENILRNSSSSFTGEHAETQRLGNLARAQAASEWKTQDLDPGVSESKTQHRPTGPPGTSPTIPEEILTFLLLAVDRRLSHLFLNFYTISKTAVPWNVILQDTNRCNKDEKKVQVSLL